MERHFDVELAELKSNLLKMGLLVEESIAKSIEALRKSDQEIARNVIVDDKVIDDWELKIDEECLDLLALHQPVAVDLRFITMTMKISTDLERIADLAVDIAQRVLELSGKPLLKPLIDIPRLAVLAQEMTRDALVSFINKDVELSKRAILRDQEADKLRNAVQEELINNFIAKDKTTTTRAIPLLLIARHLERICDHSTNIAEDAIFLIKGRVVKHHLDKLENGK